MVEPSFLAIGAVMIPSSGTIPVASARYSRWISRFFNISERIEEERACFAGTVKMPGNDQKTGGVPVKPVNAAVDKRLAFLFEIPCTGIGKCVVIISLGRVNWHSGRFIDDQQVRIFIYDRKRQI